MNKDRYMNRQIYTRPFLNINRKIVFNNIQVYIIYVETYKVFYEYYMAIIREEIRP